LLWIIQVVSFASAVFALASVCRVWASRTVPPGAWRLARGLTGLSFAITAVVFVLLLVRDWRPGMAAETAFTFLDMVIILGIAWIPCFLVLKIPRIGRLAYLPACVAALVWTVLHTPSHIGPRSGMRDTMAMQLAVLAAGFALCNSLVTGRPQTQEARLATAGCSLALLLCAACAAWGLG